MNLLLNKKESLKPHIATLPDCKRLFYKLHLQNWQNNPVESKYMKPLCDCFMTLQRCLVEMKVYGINYWKIPLHTNEKLMKCLHSLMNADIIAETMIGNPLKRDQLNFIYNTILLIHKSDEKIKENLLKKDENLTKFAIPQLIIFKQIQHILHWKCAKKEREEKMRIINEKLILVNSIKQEERAQSPLNVRMGNKSMSQVPSRSNTARGKTVVISKSPKKEVKHQVDPEDIPLIEYAELEGDEEIYGRYWYLEGLVGKEVREEIEECVELLRHINEAVQQDMEDSYIKIGLTTKQKRGDKKDKQETPYYLQLSEQENSNIAMNVVRPPELWNFPEILKDHKFRSIANPNKCYDDHRVDGLDKKIIELAQKFNNYRRITCQELISRVIDVFSGEENLIPTPIDPQEDPNWRQPEPTPHELEVMKKRESQISQQQINAQQALQQTGQTQSQAQL